MAGSSRKKTTQYLQRKYRAMAYFKPLYEYLQELHKSDLSFTEKLEEHALILQSFFSVAQSLQEITPPIYKGRNEGDDRKKDATKIHINLRTLRSAEYAASTHRGWINLHNNLRKEIGELEHSIIGLVEDISSDTDSPDVRKSRKVVRDIVAKKDRTKLRIARKQHKEDAANAFFQELSDTINFFRGFEYCVAEDNASSSKSEDQVNASAWAYAFAQVDTHIANQEWRRNYVAVRIQKKEGTDEYYSLVFRSTNKLTRFCVYSIKKTVLSNGYATLAKRIILHFNQVYDKHPFLAAAMKSALSVAMAEQILSISLEDFSSYKDWDDETRKNAQFEFDRIIHYLQKAIEDNENQFRYVFYVNLNPDLDGFPKWHPVSLQRLHERGFRSREDVEVALVDGSFSKLSESEMRELDDVEQLTLDYNQKLSELNKAK